MPLCYTKKKQKKFLLIDFEINIISDLDIAIKDLNEFEKKCFQKYLNESKKNRKPIQSKKQQKNLITSDKRFKHL